MDFVINEYALDGQFETIEVFVDWIYEEWLPVMELLIKKQHAIYKKTDIYSRNITRQYTLQDVLRKEKNNPVITAIKLFLVKSAYEPPYWDEEKVIKTDLRNTYVCPHDTELPNCFSEAIERDGFLLSVYNSNFICETIPYFKNDVPGEIINLVDRNSILRLLLTYENTEIRFVFEHYKFNRKVSFAEHNGKCYAEEAILESRLSSLDRLKILLNISELICALDSGKKTHFWDNLGEGIFEYRVSISDGREFRLLFIQDNSIIFLNGFIKKTEKTPKMEIEKAKSIKKLFMQSH